MSPRRPFWPVGTDPAVVDCAVQSPTAALTVAPVAPCGPLPVRSAIAAQVKLARLASLLREAAGILHELSEVPLADARDSRLMSHVETTSKRPRLMSIQDLAERLQLAPRTVRRMRAQGQLPPAIDLHSALRWDEATIDAWIEGRRER